MSEEFLNDPEPSAHRNRVTLRAIAQAVGVSHVTVSLALRNHPRISEPLRKKIQDQALAMGYRPDPMLAALTHYRHSRTDKPMQAGLAWLNAWPEPGQLRAHREFDLYWRGATRAAEKFGYRLEEFVVSEEMPLPRIEKVLLTRGIRGILIPPVPTPAGVDWRLLDWMKFSAARLGRRAEHPQVHFITSAQAANTILSFDKMRERGYERIAFVGEAVRFRMFGAGFYWAQLDVPNRLRLTPFLFPEAKVSQVQKAFEAWLKRTKPEAILTDVREVPHMLERAGYRVPEDIGVAATTVWDIPVDAGIDQNPEEIGRVAVLVLISLIHDHVQGEPGILREILVRGNWVDGASLPQR